MPYYNDAIDDDFNDYDGSRYADPVHDDDDFDDEEEDDKNDYDSEDYYDDNDFCDDGDGLYDHS